MTLRCPQVKKVWLKKRSGVSLRAASLRRRHQPPGVAVRVRERVHVPSEIVEALSCALAGRDQDMAL